MTLMKEVRHQVKTLEKERQRKKMEEEGYEDEENVRPVQSPPPSSSSSPCITTTFTHTCTRTTLYAQVLCMYCRCVAWVDG